MKRLLTTLSGAMLLMAVGMLLFEVIKSSWFPNTSLWESHFLTIGFSTVIVGLAAFFVFRAGENRDRRLACEVVERKRAEEELRKLNAELEQRVSERTVELEMRKLELEDFLENATEGLHWVDDDGQIIWANQAELNLLGYLVAVVRDITERKRAEERVRQQARLLDLAHDAIIVRDLQDRVLYWNQGAGNIYGWTAEEAVGKKASDLLPVDAIAYEAAKKVVQEKGGWKGDATVRTKDGQEVLVEADWTLVRDDQGIPQSIMVISSDITEKRKLEVQTLRSQRMESVGTLAGGIAHDLNNVLTPLLISVQLLKRKLTDADGQKLLATLEANVQRGAKLVKQVLAFGRGVKGDRIQVEPESIVREIGQIIHETFPKSLEFETRSIPDLWTVIGDATQLHQVLLNLCVNARDAMPDGGKLTIKLENTVLDELYAGINLEARPGPYVTIHVADTGTGIPKEVQDKMFEPFFTTKEIGKGTGLGLSTCFSIIKSHGGFINCYSEPGKGSIFKVYLPANTNSAAAENPASQQTQLPHGNNELVLVVDDEKAILDIAQKVLEHFGYRVLTAGHGAEAIALYRQHQKEIDVVLTDMMMPVMDGPTAIIALKAINPRVKIIGASGLDSTAGMAKATDAGIVHFIPKPYTGEIILHTLHKVLHPNHSK